MSNQADKLYKKLFNTKIKITYVPPKGASINHVIGKQGERVVKMSRLIMMGGVGSHIYHLYFFLKNFQTFSVVCGRIVLKLIPNIDIK